MTKVLNIRLYRWLFSAIVLLMLSTDMMAMSTADSLKLRQLRKDMYQFYSRRRTNDFLNTISQLKALARQNKLEKEYYKAYGNEIIYTSSYIHRGKAIEMAKHLFAEAEREHSSYGLYTANYVLGTIHTALSHFDESASHLHDALEILKEDYPDENRAALYLALSKVERARGNRQQVLKYVEHVLTDPKSNNMHKMSALSYKCLVLYDMKASVEEQDKAYAEREQMKKKLGHDDNFGYVIDFNEALLHDDLEWAQQVVDSLPEANKTTQLHYYSRLYYAKKDYKKAYDYYLKYRHLFDSLNNDEIRKTSLDMGVMLDKARIENEAKDLRLANQRLEMDQIAHQLEEKRLQEYALSMAIENQRARLEEMEASRANDSLMAINKERELSEFQSKMDAREQAERARQLKWIAALVLTIIALVFIVVYALSRRKQLRKLREAYDKLEETTSAKERIESELRIARNIQMAMVPHLFPKTKGLDIYASMTPAKEVGGDLYDFVEIDDILYFCLGDVSGKGVPAALFMSMSARLFRTLCKYRLTPAEIAKAMNNELAQNNDNGMFVTMFIGLLHLKTGYLEYCNAGHNPPILDGEFIQMEANAPLGLWENLEYEGEALGDISGKQLFVYSDGLNEAENHDHDQYSDDRLLTFIREHRNMEAHQLIDLLTEDVQTHVNGAAPSDDMTMLCLREN